MKRKSKLNGLHLVASLVALVSAGGVRAQSLSPGVVDLPNSPRPETGADSQKHIREELFDALVKFNYDVWNERISKDIFLADTKLRAQWEEEGANLDRLIAREKASKMESLRLASSRVPASTESLEATLSLASLLLQENIASEEAGLLLNSMLQQPLSKGMEVRQKMAAHLMRGQRLLSLKKYAAARSDFDAVIESARGVDSRSGEYALRAYIGLGDTAYGEFLFSKAEGHYAQALRGLQRAPLSDYAALEPTLAGLYVRLVWSSFRSGRSLSTATYASEYARRRDSLRERPPANVEEELVRVAGISFFERSDRAADLALANDARGGEFGKRIVLASLSEEIRAGTYARGDARARAVSGPFLKSSSAFAFLETRAVLAEFSARTPADRKRAKRDVEWEAVLLAARGSPWSKAFDAQTSLRELRRAVLLRLGESVGAGFADEGRAGGQREAFLKSHAAFHARLGEFYEGESRGPLLLASAESALLGGAFEEAWNEAMLAFRHPLSRDSERKGFVLLVRAGDAQSAGALSPSDPYFTRYISAVDAFVAEYSGEAEARQALFASGLKLERLGYNSEALERYERTLALVPRQGPRQGSSQDVNLAELENVLRGLLAFHMSHSEPARAASSLSEMEAIVRDNEVSASLRVEIELASAAQMRLHASDLRRRGSLDDAAHAQALWSQKHPQNPESASLLRDAILGFYEAGDWKKAREAIDFFLRRFDKHPLVWDVLAWRGRVDEARLAFQSAALSYVAAAFEDVSVLPTATRVDLLSRAALLLAQGGNEKEAANVRKKIAELRGQGDNEGASFELMSAAQLMLRASRPQEAAVLFEKAAEMTASPMRARSWRMEALEANALWRDISDADVAALESLVLRRARGETQGSGAAERSALAVRALVLGLRRLENLAQGASASNPRALQVAMSTLQRLERLAAPFGKSPQVSLAVSRAHAAVVPIASRRDPLLAERLRTKARTSAFDAFFAAPKGSQLRALATQEVRLYTPVSSGDLPPLEPVTPDAGSADAWHSLKDTLLSRVEGEAQ